MTFDPEAYTITIRKEEHDGEIFYVGKVAEFPNIVSFEESFGEAHVLVIDAIQTLKNIADETQAMLPLPYPAPSDEFSGRVTLRLPKTLHAKVARMAEQDAVSVNQYLVTAIASYVGETDGISKVVSNATNSLSHIVGLAVSHAVNRAVTTVAFATTRFFETNVTTPSINYVEGPHRNLFAVSNVYVGATQ